MEEGKETAGAMKYACGGRAAAEERRLCRLWRTRLGRRRSVEMKAEGRAAKEEGARYLARAEIRASDSTRPAQHSGKAGKD
jgi:hypothetical protein